MTDKNNTNECCEDSLKSKFDAGMLFAKNFNRLSDDTIAQMSTRTTHIFRMQNQEKERVSTVLQDISTNPQKRKAAEHFFKTEKKRSL